MSTGTDNKQLFNRMFGTCPCPTCGYELRVAVEASEDGVVQCTECGNECDLEGIEAGRKPTRIWLRLLPIAGCIVPLILFLAAMKFFAVTHYGISISGSAVSGLVGMAALALFSVVIELERDRSAISFRTVAFEMFVLAMWNTLGFVALAAALALLSAPIA